MKSTCVFECEAASGLATPSSAPWPNRSGVFEILRSNAYAMNVVIVGPVPGIAPNSVPMQRAAQHREKRLLQLGLARAHVAQAHLGLGADEVHPVDAAQEIRDAEEAQRQRDEIDADP